MAKADEIWKLEVLGTLASDENIKASVQKDIQKIASTCTLEELLWIDAYINEHYVNKT